MVAERWHTATGEVLDPRDQRVTMLGDRGRQTESGTEEMWRVTHAVALWIIHTTAKEAKSSKEDRATPYDMLQRMRRTLQTVAGQREKAQRDAGVHTEFMRSWDLAVVKDDHGRTRVTLLDEVQREETVPYVEPARLVYTDGAHNAKARNGKAGWAFITLAVSDATVQLRREKPNFQKSAAVTDKVNTMRMEKAGAGQVETEKTRDNYCGARKHTNNTGELTALLHAVREEYERMDQSDGVEFNVDSTYTINTATGRWDKPTRGKNAELAKALATEYARLKRARRLGAVRIAHVKGHSGHFGNDRADELAKWARDGGRGNVTDEARKQWERANKTKTRGAASSTASSSSGGARASTIVVQQPVGIG